jgi:hypothetical protein
VPLSGGNDEPVALGYRRDCLRGGVRSGGQRSQPLLLLPFQLRGHMPGRVLAAAVHQGRTLTRRSAPLVTMGLLADADRRRRRLAAMTPGQVLSLPEGSANS